jgi:hypothetical protein
VQYFQAERILCVTDVPLYPLEEGLNLAEVIFGGDFPLKENIDRLLADVEILYALADERLNMLESFARAQVSFRNAQQRNLRLIGAR